MRWRGSERFIEVLAKAGYGRSERDLERLSRVMGERMEKPPTASSIRTCCLSAKGEGYKKPKTIQALCGALGCIEEDLYRVQPRSQWDRIREGFDPKIRESWPI